MRMNTAKLRGKIVECGLRQEDVAKEIGIDASTMSRKLNSGGEMFTIGQMHKLADVLKLTSEEAADIFLQPNSQ